MNVKLLMENIKIHELTGNQNSNKIVLARMGNGLASYLFLLR
ncbi:hypothetical protein SAMN05421639_1077 [Chryseobacterium shigense]|uniref:Uncharacterized protein n=1 Tax=Chryseobacterium shigense TaxID=297244 RepID=A0A1N7JKG3_9FLAO|nr:hypothetical protein SAMN05421639_1077 [Chryseobacterium shigense]